MHELKISATAHGLNYLPEYFADDRGLFAAQDLTVTATAKDPGPGCSRIWTAAPPISRSAACGCLECTGAHRES